MNQLVSRASPTSAENKAKIDTCFKILEVLISNLWCRWQDEKDHEDINDYAVPITKKLPEGFNLRRMTKRPFGFEFDIGTGAVYHIYTNSREYGWKRLA